MFSNLLNDLRVSLLNGSEHDFYECLQVSTAGPVVLTEQYWVHQLDAGANGRRKENNFEWPNDSRVFWLTSRLRLV